MPGTDREIGISITEKEAWVRLLSSCMSVKQLMHLHALMLFAFDIGYVCHFALKVATTDGLYLIYIFKECFLFYYAAI